MISRRPYRKGLPKEKVISELKENSGTQFDPKLVKICLNLIKDKKIEVNN
jgi:HD-GYP domain-containing protein (c-di-GMP phosphodiesterase class II)